MRPRTLQRVRLYHLYLGVFFAPLLLLFSVSGVLQTFRIPDRPDAATWIKWIAAVHKDQAPPHDRPKKAGVKPADDHDHGHDDHGAPASGKHPDPLPLKILVTLMSFGLITSILLGLTIALNNRATRRTSVILLVVGAVLPCVLLWV